MVLSFIVFIFGIIVLPLVFVRIIYPGLLRKKPSFAAITAAFFVLLGFFVSFFIFQAALSIAIIAFSSLMILPFVIKFLESEEKPSVHLPEQQPENQAQSFYIKPQRQWLYSRSLTEIFQRHEKLILFYIFLFAGMAIEYTLLFAVLPPGINENAFSNQLQLLQPRGSFVAPELFWSILTNNIQLVFVAFALSVLYGSGSILILSYNASIAGVLYGSSIRTLIYGTPPFAANIIAFLPHTIIEILGYLLAAVAGGILINGLYRENIRDSLIIFAFALTMIIVGAWVEIIVPFL
ncbi:MAG: stage II sporulation protein M [Candidatus Aenigmarchaeota archaeon]|nr:stage II sporulation protein M [Candidatus Aenigmarchaeota archaeon]